MREFLFEVGAKTYNLLSERRAILYTGRKPFCVWMMDDHALVIFDTAMIDIGKVNNDFVHRLSTRLDGRFVLRTNSRGLYLQVDPQKPVAALPLFAKPLDLDSQPTPHHMPIGLTERGDLWVSLLKGDSFFVVGLRGMGKSAMLHGMIQSLLHGGETLVYAWDEVKQGAEFLRYVGMPNFTLFAANGLQEGLQMIQAEATRRMRMLAQSGHANTVSYNEAVSGADRILPMALVMDEVAEVDDQDLLVKQVKLNRAAGLYPIFATNDPTKAAVIAKSNLATRISFAVISTADSITGLGRPGANKLPAMQGRGMVVHNGRLVEFQSFTVDYPMPNEAGLKWLEEHVQKAFTEETRTLGNEIETLADSIRARWSPELSLNKTSELLGKPYAGNSWCAKVKQVYQLLSTTTTTANGQNEPVLGSVAS